MVSDKQLCLSMVLVGTDRFLTIIDLSSRAMVDPVISSQNMIDPDRFWQVLTDPHGFWRVLVGPYELRWANIDPDKIALKNCRKPLKICAIRFINFWHVLIGFVWFLAGLDGILILPMGAYETFRQVLSGLDCLWLVQILFCAI